MNKNWSNTVLVAYPLLPKIAKELDFRVKSRVNSSFQSRHLKIGVSNEQLIGEILKLTEEKRKIVNLRYIANLALNGISAEDRQILTDRIINKKTLQTISDGYGIALRTVFRRLSSAEQAFSRALSREGFNEIWLEKEYGNSKFIAPIHQRILNDKYFVAKNM